MTSILLVLEVVNSRNGTSKDWISFGPMNHPFVARANEANENATQCACALDFWTYKLKSTGQYFQALLVIKAVII